MGVSDHIRHTKKSVVFESYKELGYNYRLTDIQAAIGLVQLTRLNGIVIRRRKLAELYKESLQEIGGIDVPSERSNTRTNWQSYCIRIDESFSTNTIMQELLDRGISSRRGIICSHMEPAYNSEPWTWIGKDSGKPINLKQSETARDHCILLPLFHEMKVKDIKIVCKAIKEIMTYLNRRKIY